MPNWGEHLLIANKILKKIKIDENLFLFGNILPDVQDGYLVKGISNIQPHNINHFDFHNGNYSSNNKKGYEVFFERYSEKMNNSIIIGYLSHLVTDSLWNDVFYNEKCIKEDNELIGVINKEGKLIKGDKKKLREYKQEDFRIFQYYIYKNYNMKLPKFSFDISKNANIIENININDEDVRKVIEYINETEKNSNSQNLEMKIFTTEELEEQIDKTVSFANEFLNMQKFPKKLDNFNRM